MGNETVETIRFPLVSFPTQWCRVLLPEAREGAGVQSSNPAHREMGTVETCRLTGMGLPEVAEATGMGSGET